MNNDNVQNMTRMSHIKRIKWKNVSK